MNDRRARIVVLAAGVLLSVLVAVGESMTHVHHNSAAYLILGLAVGWSFLVAGQVAWLRRPQNRIGPLMCATALAWMTTGLSDWPSDVVFTFGLLFTNLWLALLVHTILAYPSGRLASTGARLVTIGVYLDTWVAGLAVLAFTEPRLDGSDRRSAHNLLLVQHHHGLVEGVDSISLGIGVGLITAMLVILARRWMAATAASRRVLTPMYATGAASMIVIGLIATYSVFFNEGDLPFYLFSLTMVTVPQGFLYGLLRTQIGRSAAMRELIAEIESSDDPDRLRNALQQALGDPTLELVYWLPDTDSYVDVHGTPILRPDAMEGRAVTTIERRDRRILQMVHDASLLDEPAVLQSAASAAALALRNQSLAGELRAQLREVAASERRLSELLENVRLIAASLDTQGLITYANPFLCELSGWSSGYLIGKDWLTVFGGTQVRFLERVAEDDVLPYEENSIHPVGRHPRDRLEQRGDPRPRRAHHRRHQHRGGHHRPPPQRAAHGIPAGRGASPGGRRAAGGGGRAAGGGARIGLLELGDRVLENGGRDARARCRLV